MSEKNVYTLYPPVTRICYSTPARAISRCGVSLLDRWCTSLFYRGVRTCLDKVCKTNGLKDKRYSLKSTWFTRFDTREFLCEGLFKFVRGFVKDQVYRRKPKIIAKMSVGIEKNKLKYRRKCCWMFLGSFLEDKKKRIKQNGN